MQGLVAAAGAVIALGMICAVYWDQHPKTEEDRGILKMTKKERKKYVSEYISEVLTDILEEARFNGQLTDNEVNDCYRRFGRHFDMDGLLPKAVIKLEDRPEMIKAIAERMALRRKGQFVPTSKEEEKPAKDRLEALLFA